MRKGVILLFLFLAACGTIPRNPINVANLTQVESAYGIVLAAAVGYRNLYKINRCTVKNPESATNICARRSVIVTLQSADLKAQVAMRAARRFVKNNPNLDAGAYIDGARLAVDAFRQIAQQNRVMQ